MEGETDFENRNRYHSNEIDIASNGTNLTQLTYTHINIIITLMNAH